MRLNPLRDSNSFEVRQNLGPRSPIDELKSHDDYQSLSSSQKCTKHQSITWEFPLYSTEQPYDIYELTNYIIAKKTPSK